MSDLLRKWMQQEVGVTVPINNFEKDFANGYAFGELLYRCNLQPDFEQFIDSSGPDAVLKNFTRLQPTLAKLGVPLDSRTVDSIQKGQKGVVGRVIYAIKVAVDGLEKELCAPVGSATGQSLSSTDLRSTSATTLRASQTLLEARNWKQEKIVYDNKMVSIFEESLRRRSLNPNAVMESLHLRKFTEEAIRQDNFNSDGKRQDMEEKERKRDMRRQTQRTKQKERQEYMKKRESENIRTWIKNRARMRSLEAADLEREMDYAHKLEASIARKNRQAGNESRAAIEDFEKTMSRTMPAGVGFSEADDSAMLETIERGSMPSLEHMQYLRTKVPSTEEMEANARAYMSRMRAKKAEEGLARKERERRRRYTILEHQKQEERLESERRANTILETISRRSELESRTQTNLDMLLQEHKIMKENKAFRESQYAARYEADDREAQVREEALASAVQDDCVKTTSFEKQKWQETQEETKKQRSHQIKCFAHETVWQLLGLAERCIEYREISEQAGGDSASMLVPRKEWREWKTLMLLGKKLIADAPPLTEPITETKLNIALDDAALQDYMSGKGEWDANASPSVSSFSECPDAVAALPAEAEDAAADGVVAKSTVDADGATADAQDEEGARLAGTQATSGRSSIGTNVPFGNMVFELSQLADASEASTNISTTHLACKIAVIGKPFAGQSVVSRRIADKYGLVLINADAVVQEAVTAATAGGSRAAPTVAGSAGDDDNHGEIDDGNIENAADAIVGSSADDMVGDHPGTFDIERVTLGRRAHDALLEGGEVDDATIVDLVVNAIQRLCPPPAEADRPAGEDDGDDQAIAGGVECEPASQPSAGFVLDGFPRTAEQAKLLERRLTGLDLDEERARRERMSTLAPPEAGKLQPLRVRNLVSGLDNAFWLSCSDETALVRAKAFVTDPETGRVYHLEFDPPPAGVPGLHERLLLASTRTSAAVAAGGAEVGGATGRGKDDLVTDPAGVGSPQAATASWSDGGKDTTVHSHHATQAVVHEVQSQLAAALGCHEELVEWTSRFDKLTVDVDAEANVDSITACVERHIEQILKSKDVAMTLERAAQGARKACDAAVEAARHAEEARRAARMAAGHLFSTKKAEVEASALISPAGKGKTGGGGSGQAAESTDPSAGSTSFEGAVGLIGETASAEIAKLLKKAAESVEVAEAAAKSAEKESLEAANIANVLAADLANTNATADAMSQAEAAVKSALAAQERSNAAAKNANEAAREAADVWKDALEKGLSSENVPEKIAAAAAAAAAVTGAEAKGAADAKEASDDGEEAAHDDGEADRLSSEMAAECEAVMHAGALDLYGRWQSVESDYFANLRRSFKSIREERSLNLAHFVEQKEFFKGVLQRPDRQQMILDSFQANFNAIDLDMRRLEDAKAELILRSDELRDSLWDICDERLRTAEKELNGIVTDSYIASHTNVTAGHFASIAQAEFDRCQATLEIIRRYTELKVDVEKKKQGRANSGAGDGAQEGSGDGTAKEEVAKDGEADNASGASPETADAGTGAEKNAPSIDVVSAAADESITADALNEYGEEQLPEWAHPLAKVAPSLAKAMLDALKQVSAPETEESDAPSAAGASADADGETVVPSNRESEHAAAALAREREILAKRIALIAKRALEVIKDLHGLGDRTHGRLKEWMTSRFKGECSAVAALHDVVKRAVALESELPYHLRLEGETMILDETELVVEPTPLPPEVPENEPRLSKGYMNCGQLSALSALFKQEFADGLVSIDNAAYVIQRTGSISCGVSLPEEWLSIDVSRLQRILSAYEIADSGLIDWREMIVGMLMASYPQVIAPSPESIQEVGSFLAEVDLDRDGIVSADEFLSVKFWFSKNRGILGRNTPSRGFDLHYSLTRLLFQTFSKPGLKDKEKASSSDDGDDECVDFKSVLLYLSMDYRLRFALLKSLAVEQMGNTWQPISSRQLYNICYPLGYVPAEYADMEDMPLLTTETLDGMLQAATSQMSDKHFDTIEKQNEGILDRIIQSDFFPKMELGALSRYKLKDIAISLSC